jgi:hypothetical protein
VTVAGAEPSDAELGRGILDALRLGLTEVARVLSVQLADRRAQACRRTSTASRMVGVAAREAIQVPFRRVP